MSKVLTGLLNTGAILGTWLVLAGLFGGLGLLLQRPFRLSKLNGDLGLQAVWLGFAFSLLFLQIWHFLLPVDGLPLLVLGGLALVGLVSAKRPLVCWLGRCDLRTAAPFALLALGGALWVANQALGAPTQYDSGMYHVPAIQWFKAYPAVPGLGNLHGRLAFNNSSLLYAAMLEVGPWAGRSSHVANSFLIFLLLGQILRSPIRLFRSREPRSLARFTFESILIVPVLATMVHEDARSYAPDVAVAVVLLAAACWMFGFLIDPPRNAKRSAHDTLFVTTLLVAAVSIKLSAVAFAVVAGSIVVLVAWTRRRRAQRRSAPVLIAAVAVAATFGVVWMARGVILSGYPAYPSGILSVPVDWRVPAEQAAAELAWTVRHGRWPEAGPGWGWVGPWLRSMAGPYRLVRVLWPTAITGLALLLTLALRRRSRRPESPADAGYLMLLPATAGVALWFFTSPHPRFGFFLFWVAAATVLGLAAHRWMLAGRSAGAKGFALSILLLSMAVAVFERPVLQLVKSGAIRSDSVLRSLKVWLHPAARFGQMPSPELESYTTPSGLTLHVPREDNRCWDAPLPCTPHPAPNLRLRDPESLESGFRIEGPWQPRRWPNPWSDFLEEWRRRTGRNSGSEHGPVP